MAKQPTRISNALPLPRRLAVAALLSLLLHGGLLLLLARPGGLSSPPPAAALTVLYARLQEAEPAAPPAPETPPLPAPSPQSPVAAPTAVPQPPASPPGPAGARVSRPPQPLSNPRLDGITIRGAGIPARIRVGTDGAMMGVEFGRTELPEATLEALAKALVRVRFRPALEDGQPVEAYVPVRFCFDDDGALSAASSECWAPPPPQAKQR